MKKLIPYFILILSIFPSCKKEATHDLVFGIEILKKPMNYETNYLYPTTKINGSPVGTNYNLKEVNKWENRYLIKSGQTIFYSIDAGLNYDFNMYVLIDRDTVSVKHIQTDDNNLNEFVIIYNNGVGSYNGNYIEFSYND